MQLSLRNKFLVPTVALVIVGTCISTMISYINSKNALEDAIKGQITQIAAASTENITSWVERSKLDIGIWSDMQIYKTAVEDSLKGRAAQKSANRQLMKLRDDYRFYESLYVANPKGEVISSSTPELIGTLNVAEHQHFQKALHGDVVISEVIKSELTENPVFVIASPIKERDVAVGVLLGVLSLEYLSQMYRNDLKVGKTGYAYIYDKQGRVIVHSDQSQVLQLNMKELDFGREMMNTREGVRTYLRNGVEEMVAFKRSELTGWTIGVAVATQEILTPVKRIGYESLMVALAVVALTIIVILLLVRSIIHPITQGVHLAKSIAEGDLTATIDVNQRDEIGVLINALKEMQDKIRDVLKEIEGLLQAVQEGRLDQRANADAFNGGWRDLTIGINGVIDAFVMPVQMTAEYIDRISKGDIPEKITREYKGDFNKIRNNLNILTEAMTETTELAEEIARGNLKVNVRERSESDRFMKALKVMISALHEIVTSVKLAADNVASGSQQMSFGAQEMSQGASEQAAVSEEASSSIEQMVANIRQNADNALQTEKIALKSAEDAAEGGQAVVEVVSAMKKIAKRITIIEEIARQTHMLSLNATIEAAKAQEHGRGFAIVASEVRALAESSRIAAEEINELTNSSVAIAEKAGEMLTSLVPTIQKTSRLVQEINAASSEQSIGAEQINKAIQQLDHVIQQNASHSEEMASTTEELAIQAEQLQHTVAFFSTNGTPQENRENGKFTKEPIRKEKKRERKEQAHEHAGIKAIRTDDTSPGYNLDVVLNSEAEKSLDTEFERY